MYLVMWIWFARIHSCTSYFFEDLTSFCAGIGTKIFQVQRWSNLMSKWFTRIAKIFKKTCSIKSLKELNFSWHMSWHLSLHRHLSENQLRHDRITYLSSMSWSSLSIALSFMTSHTPTFLSRIHLFPIFPFILPCK